MCMAAIQNAGERIEISRRDRLEFVEALLSPPSPHDHLQFAMRRRNEAIRER